MATCVSVAPDNSLILDTLTQVPNCPYLLYTGSEYTTILGFNDLFNTYFLLDVSVFEFITGSYLIAFISGHVLGRVVSKLR